MFPHANHFRNTVARAGSLFAKNPALFCRLIAGKLNSVRPMPPLPVRRRIGSVEIEFNDAAYRGTAPMYFGSYSLPVVNAMRRHLKPGDVFVDVGANIGYLSAVAANLVGVHGEVHCFEPVARYFDRLQELARSNPSHCIIVNHCAAGDFTGESVISVAREPGQSTMVPGYKTGSDVESTQAIHVTRLDEYLFARDLRNVGLIKIDAEGFELPVLKGLETYLQSAAELPAIICEIAPKAYHLMNRKVSELTAFTRAHGYDCFDIFDGKTPVELESVREVEDVLFLPTL